LFNFYNFNVQTKNSLAFLYCEKNKEICGDWLKHFYSIENINEKFIESDDGKYKNMVSQSCKLNRFLHYL